MFVVNGRGLVKRSFNHPEKQWLFPAAFRLLLASDLYRKKTAISTAKPSEKQGKLLFSTKEHHCYGGSAETVNAKRMAGH